MASSRCCGGQKVTSSTLSSSARTCNRHGRSNASKSNAAAPPRPKALRTKRVRMMGPRSQQPYDGSGCSPRGWWRRFLRSSGGCCPCVDAPQKQDAGLGKVVGRLRDRVPQLARRHGGVHPQPISALVGALRITQGRARPRAVNQLPRAIGLNGFDERIRHAHRHVEVVPAAGRALGGDELPSHRVVDAQHAHLRATARARAFDRGAGLVEHIDVAAGPRRHGCRALTSAPRGRMREKS